MDLSAEDRKELEGILESDGLIGGCVHLRRTRGLTLEAALAIARPIQQAIGDQQESSEMGMCAELLAIGPFRRDLVRFYAYPARSYANTSEGSPMVEYVVRVYEGSGRSRVLASCFGIDPWNFDQHKLNPHAAKLDLLREEFDADEVEKFLALRDAGYDFYFLPNG